MAKASVNTNGGFDTAFLVLFLFFPLRRAGHLVGSLWGRIDARFMEGYLTPRFGAMGVTLLAAIVLLLLVQRSVMSRIVGAGAYEVARAALMAVIGAVLLFVCCAGSILMGLGLLEHSLLPDLPWVDALIMVVTLFISFGVAGFWSGWRFGKWDFFWGIVMALFIWTAVPRGFLSHVASFEGALWVAVSLTGALLGARLGVARFQRGAKKTQPDAEPAAS